MTLATASATHTATRFDPTVRNCALLRQVKGAGGDWVGLDYHGNIVEADGITVDTDDLPQESIETGNPSWWMNLASGNCTGKGLTSDGFQILQNAMEN